MLAPKEQFKMPIVLIDLEEDTVKDVIPQLIGMKYVYSKSEFIKLLRQGDVQINDERVYEDDLDQVLINSDVIRIGKKRFLK